MSAQRIARRRISAEKQASAANTDFANLNNNLDVNDYDTKMKSRDVKNCLDKMDGNLSPASIRRRTTRSKSVQNSDLMSHDISMNLTRKQVRSASDAQLSLDKLQTRMGMSSATSDETFDESKEMDDHVTSDKSQLEELISPRSWSDMIASDIAISYDQTDDHRQHNSNNNNHKSDTLAKTIKVPDQLKHGNGVLKKAFVEDVTFHDVSSRQRIRSFEPKDDVITPRTWDEMVAEDSESRDHTQDRHDNGEPTSEQGLHPVGENEFRESVIYVVFCCGGRGGVLRRMGERLPRYCAIFMSIHFVFIFSIFLTIHLSHTLKIHYYYYHDYTLSIFLYFHVFPLVLPTPSLPSPSLPPYPLS